MKMQNDKSDCKTYKRSRFLSFDKTEERGRETYEQIDKDGKYQKTIGDHDRVPFLRKSCEEENKGNQDQAG